MKPLLSASDLGILLVVGGLWLCFDVASTLSVHCTSESGWIFCLPFFLGCVDAGHWTFVFDIGVGMVLSGTFVMRDRFNLKHVPRETVLSTGKILLCGVAVGVILLLVLMWLNPLRFVLG